MLINDIRKFWRVIQPKDEDTITLVDSTGNVIPSSQCALVLNEVFSCNFSVTSGVPIPDTHGFDYLVMSPILIEPTGVESLIRSLKPSSSPGCDSINPKFLKSTSVYSSIILSKIFQQSLDNGYLPGEWKVGKVIPLHKSGSKSSPFNYTTDFTNQHSL